jgi:hypothetical protein
VQQAGDAQLADRLQEHVHAEDVGPEKLVGVEDRAVHVRHRGEVDHRVHAARHVADQLGIADVAVHERVARVALEVGEVGRVAGVGQLVEVDDAIVGVLGEDVADEVGSDEPRAAGHQQLHLTLG